MEKNLNPLTRLLYISMKPSQYITLERGNEKWKIYGDHKTSFSQLSNIDKSVTIHQRILQYLLIQIYKVKKGISPTIMNGIFQFFESPVYELRSDVHLLSRSSRTVFFGTESIINLGVKLWNMVPESPLNRSMCSNLKSNTGYQIIVRAKFARRTSAKLVL